MELEGSLKAFSLPEVLQFLSMQKMSGHLHLDQPTYSIVLTIKGGRIVNSSTLQRSRKLGEMLVQRSLLKRRDLEEVLSVQKTIENDRRLGELLVERGLITEPDLRHTVRLQLEEEIWDLFSWSDGQFRFEHGEEEDLLDVMVQIDIEPLLLEGSRRQDEWSKIRRAIPKDSVVLGLGPVAEDVRSALKLKPAEWRVLSGINGSLSVDAIVKRSSLGRFETCHILYTFLSSDVIRAVDASQPSAVKDPESGQPVVPQEALARAVALAPPKNGESGGKRFGGFFGGRSKASNGGGPEPIQEAIAPASAVATLLTAFARQVVEQKDFAPKPEESRLLQLIWTEVLSEYPRADLIRVAENVADPTLLEDYIMKSDFLPAVQECHEEAVEALAKVLKIVFRLAAQRLGERTAQRILQSLIDATNSRTTYRYGGPFNLAERCYRTLGIAA